MIPWSSREALQERLRNAETMNDVVESLQAVGTTQAVRLTDTQQVGLLNIIVFWANEIEGGDDDLPEGINDLRGALQDDLHHVGIEATKD